jgi:TolB-like protein/DNA-binding winged helix-turn-helix (wHTH) protein
LQSNEIGPTLLHSLLYFVRRGAYFVPVTIYEFGDFKLDCDRFELYRSGRSLKLERKPMELLVLLAAKNGSLVTRTEIAEHLWDREVFVDTEHGINTAIRKIREVLRDDPEQSRFVQTVTGKGYRFVASVVETADLTTASPPPIIPPVESTVAANAEPPGNMQPTPSRPARLRTWLAVSTALIFLIAAAILGARALRDRSLDRAAKLKINSIAILPLDNLSGDPAQNYFADGMTDELTTMLAKGSTLRVISRTSVMQYKGVHRPLRQIAQELGVDGILEGSIERTGDRVHMTIQLIQAPSDTHVWAESYDREIHDVAALPGEAAETIAKRLNSAVASAPATHYVVPAAHDAYLRGRYLWFTNRMEESGAYFRKATEIQPDYAPAWAGLADYYGEGIAGGVLDPRTNMVPQEQAAKRALQLDPNLAEAHQAMAAVFLINRWDWANADREILQALRLDPNDAELYYLQACVLEMLNRNAEAIDAAKKEMELDPFERPYGLASIYLEGRQYDAALADLQLRMEASPNNPDLLGLTMDIWRRKGNYKEAVDASAKWHIATGDPQSAVNLQRAYAQGGAYGFIHWQLSRRLMQSKSHYVSPVELASYYAQLGDKDRTLALLEEGYQQRSTEILWIQDDPAYDFLHDDERYRSIVKRVGHPPAS